MLLLLCCFSRVRLCATTREATTMRSLRSAAKSRPICCSQRKPTQSSEDPVQPKIKRKKTWDLVTFRWNLSTFVISQSLVAQTGKRLPKTRETRVRSLGWEDPLEKEMATHSSILAWKIPWTMEPGRLQSMGSQRVGHDWVTSLSLSVTSSRKISYIWDLCPLSPRF